VICFAIIEHELRAKVKISDLNMDRVCQTGGMSTLRTARERAKAEVSAEILATAREHLAVHGAAGLSLRAVARDLGLVSSSAVYRYFANRDVLLTALIVEAYDSLGNAVDAEIEATRQRAPLERWVRAAVAVREWAVAHPHEYALVYGSPVPGYTAPEDTVVPGTRVSRALVQIVDDARAGGRLRPVDTAVLHGSVTNEMQAVVEYLEIGLSAEHLFAALLAWTQLFGLVGFEVFGQTRGIVSDHAAFFHDAAATMGAHIGL
jgi:AcrR family transcriptional regulator